MKASKYNFFFPYMEKIVGFNSFTSEFAVLDTFLKDLYDAAIRENGFDQLKEYHSDFHEMLGSLGFIVPDEEDELQKVIDLRNQIDFNDTHYHLTINPTMNCNFKCWYCYESHIKGSKMNPQNIDKIKNAVDKILAEQSNLKTFHLSWFGGEPLLYFKDVVQPLSDYIQKKCQSGNLQYSVGFTTNGYLIDPNMIEWLKTSQVDHLQITLDGHKERHDNVRNVNKNKGSYDKIVSNIFALAEAGIKVIVRINYDDKNLDDAYLILEDFMSMTTEQKKFARFSFHNVWQINSPDVQKCEDIVTEYRKNEFHADSYLSSIDGVRGSCYADKKNQVTVNYNGDLYKCTARDFTKGNKEGQLTDEGLTWYERYDQRLNSKFKNKPCLECPIMPICNGGCSQQALENLNRDYCVWENSGIEKKDLVFSRFKKMIEDSEYSLNLY